MITTYNDVYLDIRRKFVFAGLDPADLEARELVRAAANKTREEFIRDKYLFAPSDIREKAYSLAERRVSGEPLAYLIGEWDFYGLTLKVTKDVLIPRCDTEVLVDVALKRNVSESFRFLDLCTGCGCIGIAIAANRGGCRGVLADNSQKAIDVARENIKSHKLTDRLICVLADVRNKAVENLGRFDLIVANPPYIPASDMEGLDSSVKDFEPAAALCGGADGLDYYRAILDGWLCLLKTGGLIAFECGINQADEIKKLMRGYGIRQIRQKKDTGGIPRVVSGIKGV
ncbi:MAG: peptide chain release factor N(5)-glutamine methyltransferase [Clostridiales bacterium]|nr:peptide chain release factor N(5)-glutamine methyltransferase [Clostridiales bacterium]